MNKAFFGSLAILLCVFALSQVSIAAQQDDLYTPADGLAKQFMAEISAIFPHIGEIWPDADYSRIEVVFSDGQTAWVRHPDRTIIREPFARTGLRTPVESSPYGFDFTLDKTVPTLVVWLGAEHPGLPQELWDEIVRTLPSLATHESFHAWIQHGRKYPSAPGWGQTENGWQRVTTALGGGDRNTPVPIEGEPRMMRYELREALRSALFTPTRREEYLSIAAYWYDRWKSEYPKEARYALTDVIEGTASYVEVMHQIRFRYGFAKQAAQLETEIQSFSETNEFAHHGYDAGAEAYPLGALAGLLMDLRSKDDGMGWKRQLVDQGATPVDLLLKEVAPTHNPQPFAQANLELYRQVYASYIAPLEKTVLDFVELMNDPNTPLLVLPGSFIGSFSPGGFYSSDRLQAFAITPNTSGVLGLSQGPVSLKGVSLAQEAFVNEIPQACGWADFGLYLVIPWTFAIRPSADGLFELKEEILRGTVNLEIKRTSSGRIVYCGS